MDVYDVIMIVSFAICMLAHHLVIPMVEWRRVSKYRALPWKTRMEWNSRILSTIHSTLVTSFTIITLVEHRQFWEDPFFSTTPLAKVTMSISIGYMVCDVLSMMMYVNRDKVFYSYILHHTVSTVGLLYGLKFIAFTFFGILRLSTEITTPLVNLRWFYFELGYGKHSTEVLTLTWLFSVGFFIVRIAVIPVFWYIPFYAWRPSLYTKLWHYRSSCVLWVIVSIALDFVNIMWALVIVPKGVRITREALSKLKERS